jgi:UDP-N-acetylmuramoyl-tripeptide--D-alanyl-D-alanine ligase
MTRLSISQLCNLLSDQTNGCETAISGYSVDTRSLQAGDLFFALKGERQDGHQFIREARERGAVGAVVEKKFQCEESDFPFIHVDDPLLTLQNLAKMVLERSDCRVVAITGSVGKTTTKEFTKTLLGQKYRVTASLGNQNSQIGLPLAILNHCNGQEEILILEMGMTKLGQIARLVEIAPPEVALVTKVALVHAENFDLIEEIAWAKAEIFSNIATKQAFLDRESPAFESILSKYPLASFSSVQPDADYYLSSEFAIKSRIDHDMIQLGNFHLPGMHNRHNLLAAIAIARYFKMEWEEIVAAIPFLKLPEKRLQWIARPEATFIDDSYNASELSVKAAISSMPIPSKAGRKIGVLGSMLELGKFSDASHRRVGEYALDHLDRIYCYGKEALPIYEIWQLAGKPAYYFECRTSLVAHLRANLIPHDIVLLKGSRSKELWKVLEEL